MEDGTVSEELKLKYQEQLRVVKWDGDPPPDGTEPVGHPQCDEILEVNLTTGDSTVIYRREKCL